MNAIGNAIVHILFLIIIILLIDCTKQYGIQTKEICIKIMIHNQCVSIAPFGGSRLLVIMSFTYTLLLGDDTTCNIQPLKQHYIENMRRSVSRTLTDSVI